MVTTILVIIAILLVVAIGAALIYASTAPDRFMISRSALIDAPAERIFPLINDLHAQSQWSPFEKDPNMKRVHSGAPAGKGAIYEWDGNRQVGAGRIAITDSVPPSRVSLALDMSRPFAAHNTVDFVLDAEWRRNRGQHQSDLGDARPPAVHGEGDESFHQLRQDGGQPIRARSRQAQGAGRRRPHACSGRVGRRGALAVMWERAFMRALQCISPVFPVAEISSLLRGDYWETYAARAMF